MRGTLSTAQQPSPRLGAAEQAVWETNLTILWCSSLQSSHSLQTLTFRDMRDANEQPVFIASRRWRWCTSKVFEKLPIFILCIYVTFCSLLELSNSKTPFQDKMHIVFINYTINNSFRNITYFSFWIYIRRKFRSLGNTFSAFCVVTSITSSTGIPLILAIYSAAMWIFFGSFLTWKKKKTKTRPNWRSLQMTGDSASVLPNTTSVTLWHLRQRNYTYLLFLDYFSLCPFLEFFLLSQPQEQRLFNLHIFTRQRLSSLVHAYTASLSHTSNWPPYGMGADIHTQKSAPPHLPVFQAPEQESQFPSTYFPEVTVSQASASWRK